MKSIIRVLYFLLKFLMHMKNTVNLIEILNKLFLIHYINTLFENYENLLVNKYQKIKLYNKS